MEFDPVRCHACLAVNTVKEPDACKARADMQCSRARAWLEPLIHCLAHVLYLLRPAARADKYWTRIHTLCDHCRAILSREHHFIVAIGFLFYSSNGCLNDI